MEKEHSKAGIVGFAAVAVKLLPKVFKLAKVVKVGSMAVALGVYASVFNWEFALIIVTMLFVHESGHIRAMKRCGMRTKGIYFIPFFGALAVGADLFPSRKAEVYVALMGPVWGLAYACAALAVFGIFKAPMFAAVASWTALVTLFNLLPINPLDGGRVIKSITYSINGRVGLITLVAGMALAVALMMVLNIWLFALIITLNLIEMFLERPPRGGYGKFREKDEQKIGELREQLNEELHSLRPDFTRERKLEKQIVRIERRVKRSFEREAEEAKLRGMTPLTRPEIIKSAAGLLAVAAVSFIIMFAVAHIPGADLAFSVLVDE
jgi:Zn-dependent protease